LVLPNGTTQPLRIHALLDDATRYVLAIAAFHSEREADMLTLLLGFSAGQTRSHLAPVNGSTRGR
jgi:hypothetical protein